jgi:F420-dependent oxidoreductase-like protein
MTESNTAALPRVGILIPYTDREPREKVIEFVEAADRLGYESVWVPEAYGYDAITMLTLLASRTSSIGLGTGIINVFSRTPALIAQTMASLDDISGGRAILGLGTSGPQVVSGWHGMPFDRPAQRMRETVEIVRLALRREPVVYHGQVFDLPKGLKLITHPPRTQIPVCLATITDGGVALTAEIAERWMPTLFDPVAAPAVFAAALERGAARRESWLEPLLICPTVTVYISDDLAEARDQIRPNLGLYIGGMGSRERNFYNALVGRYGYVEEARRIQDLYLAGDRAAALAAVPDDLIDRLSVIGPVDHCRDRIRAYVDAGHVPLLTFAGRRLELQLEALEALSPRSLATGAGAAA